MRRITGELSRRPRIWPDSTYINKGASDSYTWTAPGIEYGNAADDIRKGGKARDGPPCIIFLIGPKIAGVEELLLSRCNFPWCAGCRWVVVRLYSGSKVERGDARYVRRQRVRNPPQ